MTVQSQIENTLNHSLDPLFLNVVNESSMHSVPPNSETHFKVVAVSEEFNGKTLVARHRLVNQLLAEQIAGPVHALSLHTLTPDEWKDHPDAVPDSPLCLGGSKKESE